MSAETPEDSGGPRGWSRLDNIPSIGMNYLYIWYRAVLMQHDRVLDDTRGRADRQIDAYQFIHALRQVHRSACMIRDALTGAAQEKARRIVLDFENAVPDAKNTRDILDHFDAYATGIGNLSHPGVRPRDRRPSESAAREFDGFYETGGASHYTIHLGPLSVEVVSARTAAERLVDELLDILGLTTSTEEELVADIGAADPGNPLHVAMAFLAGIWSTPLTPEIVELLANIVTPESRQAWGDFTEAARYTEGYAPTTIPVRAAADLAYVKLVPDTGKIRLATRDVAIVDAQWLTLQRRIDLEDRWLVHACGRYPLESSDLPWP